MTLNTALAIWTVAALFIGTVSAFAGAAIAIPWGPWRLPWPEQARRAHPARVAPVIAIYVIWMLLIPFGVMFFTLVRVVPPLEDRLLSQAISLIGPVAVAIFAARFVAPRRTSIAYWFAGICCATLLRFPTTLVYTILAIGLITLPHTPLNVVTLMLAGTILIGIIAWGGAIHVARLLGLARPALPRAANAAAWAAERVGVHAAAVFELKRSKVEVGAIVFSRYLIVTDAAAETLSDAELFALSVREMTYLKHPLLAGTARVIDMAIIYFMLACTAIGSVFSNNAMLMGVCAGFGTVLLVRPLVRRAKLKADALAAQSAIDPTDAIRALHHAYELNLSPVVASSNRSSEPHLYDRMTQARIQPPYLRPMPPSTGRIALAVLVSAICCIILGTAFFVTTQVALKG